MRRNQKYLKWNSCGQQAVNCYPEKSEAPDTGREAQAAGLIRPEPQARSTLPHSSPDAGPTVSAFGNHSMRARMKWKMCALRFRYGLPFYLLRAAPPVSL